MMDAKINESLEQYKEEVKANYKKAIRILYYLMDKGQLSIEDNRELYNEYSDKEVQQVIECIAEDLKVKIQRYNHVVYLMPEEENEVVGMKMEDLRNIAGSKRTNITAYLSMYLITLFLELFYNGVGESLKTRDYVSIDEMSKLATSRLTKAAAKEFIMDEEEELSYNVVSIKEQWCSMQEDDENHRQVNTKYGYIRSVVNFLLRQNLFVHYGYDNIRPTKKLTDLMGHHFLDQNRKEKIERLFSGKSVSSNNLISYFSHASVANTPTPPPLVIITEFSPSGIGAVDKYLHQSNAC
jgi:hypothetical protein